MAIPLYHSASEVVRDGLRLLLEKEALQTHRLTSLNEDISLGLKQLAEGNTITAEKAFASFKKRTSKPLKNV